MKYIKILAAIGALLASTSTHANTLPTPEEVQGIINIYGRMVRRLKQFLDYRLAIMR